MASDNSADEQPVAGDQVPAIADHFRLQFEQAQQSWVLLFPEGMIKLNESAGEILQRCDGTRTVADITNELEKAFDETDLSGDVASFFGIAVKQGWVALD